MKLQKWLNWEFWPWWFFYIPMFFYGSWLSLKAGALTFFVAANPRMKYGGMFGTSKYDILSNFDVHLIPKSIIVKPGETKGLTQSLQNAGITYPLIAKPDIGERGKGVQLIKTEAALLSYLQDAEERIIIQEYIDYPIELGIMYIRMPNEERGKITSIVRKDFPHVRGDGKTTLRELIKKDERGKYYFELLTKELEAELEIVLEKGELKRLVFIGNHVRGTTFLNANHLINEKLEKAFDAVSRQQPDFYVGRFDLRAKSIEELENGTGFKIMELNGVNSEPAHIYDPKMPLFKAYRDLFTHWNEVYKLCVSNHKLGVPYDNAPRVIKDLKAHQA